MPITCFNTQYKWYTPCLLGQANRHVKEHGLMQGDQRGAKEKCRGTIHNLLIDWMVLRDAQRGRRNLNMAWVDVAKAYDSVDDLRLTDMFNLHRFPLWYRKVMQKLSTTSSHGENGEWLRNIWHHTFHERSAQGRLSGISETDIPESRTPALCRWFESICVGGEQPAKNDGKCERRNGVYRVKVEWKEVCSHTCGYAC